MLQTLDLVLQRSIDSLCLSTGICGAHPDNKVELLTFLSSGVLLFSSLSMCFNSSFKPLRRDLQAALPKKGMSKMATPKRDQTHQVVSSQSYRRFKTRNFRDEVFVCLCAGLLLAEFEALRLQVVTDANQP